MLCGQGPPLKSQTGEKKLERVSFQQPSLPSVPQMGLVILFCALGFAALKTLVDLVPICFDLFELDTGVVHLGMGLRGQMATVAVSIIFIAAT